MGERESDEKLHGEKQAKGARAGEGANKNGATKGAHYERAACGSESEKRRGSDDDSMGLRRKKSEGGQKR
eukprot:4985824-Pleurochrysis_carterae.AAC.1